MDSAVEEPEFRPLDPRVIELWRILYGIGLAALFLFLVIGAILFAGPLKLLLLLIPAGAVYLIASFWILYCHLPRAYRAWGYRLNEQTLEIKNGVFFRVWRLLPLARLQYVDLHRGPLERSKGLATLLLHTAGTHYSVLVIPGLDQAEAAKLRDQLVARGGDDAV